MTYIGVPAVSLDIHTRSEGSTAASAALATNSTDRCARCATGPTTCERRTDWNTDFLGRHDSNRSLRSNGYLWALVLIALDRSPESLDEAHRVSDRACGCDRIAIETGAGHGSGAEVRWVGYICTVGTLLSRSGGRGKGKRQRQRQEGRGRRRIQNKTASRAGGENGTGLMAHLHGSTACGDRDEGETVGEDIYAVCRVGGGPKRQGEIRNGSVRTQSNSSGSRCRRTWAGKSRSRGGAAAQQRSAESINDRPILSLLCRGQFGSTAAGLSQCNVVRP